MKYLLIILTSAGNFCLLSNCEKPNGNSGNNPKSIDSLEYRETVPEAVNEIQPDTSLHCIRSQAHPIVIPHVLGKSHFELNPDGITGREKLMLPNRDSLIINNWGCEHYAITFRFVTKRFSSDTTNIQYWSNKAVWLMNEISNGIDPPLDVRTGTDLLKQSSNEYKLGQWIDYGNEVISNTVSMDRVTNLGKGYFAIEITYSIGPL